MIITLKNLLDNTLTNGFFILIHSCDFSYTPTFYRFSRSKCPAGGVDIDIYNEKGELLSGRSKDFLSVDQESSGFQLVESLSDLPSKLQEIAKTMPAYAQSQPKCTCEEPISTFTRSNSPQAHIPNFPGPRYR